jgi:predicted nucleic acid-binding protein
LSNPSSIASEAASVTGTKYLLDVNAMIAAIATNHPDYQKTDSWIRGKAIVTCPLSELGFLRITTNPKSMNLSMATARELLQSFVRKNKAEFLAADLPALKSAAQKSDQVTDYYLAELAASRCMKLATLDTGINHSAVEIVR